MIFPEYLLSLLIVYATVGFSWGLAQRGRLGLLPQHVGQCQPGAEGADFQKVTA